MNDFKKDLEVAREEIFGRIIDENGIPNRDLIFQLVIQLRGINKTLRMLNDEEDGLERPERKSYLG